METNKYNLNKIKLLILIIKREAEKLGLSNVQIMNLFEACGFSFWNINEMEKFIKELGLEECPSFDISGEKIASLNKELDEEIRKLNL